MKTEKVSGSVSTVLGEKLDRAIEFSAEYEAYETVAELREAGDFPNDKEILDYVNGKRAMNARQKKVTEITKELAEKIAETPEYKMRQKIKNILAVNPDLTEDEARETVESIEAMRKNK